MSVITSSSTSFQNLNHEIYSSSRPIIRQLDATLINQIAAGEVIERPAAALKELVENAIDAKATRIDIVIRDGGKSLIQVIDDGVGMTGADMMIAIQRHATSKLPTGDLFNIMTLGFRGEALPSIGSISRLSITSSPKDSMQTMAMELCVEGGVLNEPRPTSFPTHGTRIIIKDLFYATPARLKFLKSDTTELSACIDIVKRLALAYPAVSFKFRSEDRTLFDYTARETLGERFADVLGQKTLDNLRLTDATRDGISISGVISLPTFHKSQSTEQFFFVNQRPVRDKLLFGVLKAAYQDYLETGRHPVVALFVTVDPAEVDVNVHPSKAEVRFRDMQGVRSLMIGALKTTLQRHGQETASHLTGEALMRFQRQPEQAHNTPDMARMDYRNSPYNANNAQPNTMRQSVHPFMTSSLQNGLSMHSYVPPMHSDDVPDFDEPTNSVNLPYYPLGNAKAQIAKTYIISETTDGLIIIDQHAAHERIVYEKLKGQYLTGGATRQLLVVPLLFTIDERQCEALVQRKEHLQQLGFDIEIFGNQAAFRSIPAILQRADPEPMIHDLLTDLSDEHATLTSHEMLLNFLSTHACHTSIRAGQNLSITEMNALLRQIEATPNSGQCNHGRPTYVTLHQNDIERLFGRT
ncbi:MAG: DNA mismatch repair endonuclease MutL [Pseudomonadota bacterium]